MKNINEKEKKIIEKMARSLALAKLSWNKASLWSECNFVSEKSNEVGLVILAIKIFDCLTEKKQ